jgi:arylsulfatase A-like enzyme
MRIDYLRCRLAVFLFAGFQGLRASDASPPETPPNIVIILADDLGYGDVSCYGASRIRTPNIDRLAAQGLRFTDAHSTSATCTPARYAILTGQYPWRKKGTGVLPGDARLIISPKQTTVPSMLRKAGYTTGAVGKWHLGLGAGAVDWNTEIKPGPREIGFDYSFIMPATGDRVPCVETGHIRCLNMPQRFSCFIRRAHASTLGRQRGAG